MCKVSIYTHSPEPKVKIRDKRQRRDNSLFVTFRKSSWGMNRLSQLKHVHVQSVACCWSGGCEEEHV